MPLLCNLKPRCHSPEYDQVLTNDSVVKKGKRTVYEFEEALKELNDLVFARTGRYLNHAQTIIVKASWYDWDYKEIAAEDDIPYNAEQLQRNIGRQLWTLLTGVLGTGEKVTKKRLRGILENRLDRRHSNSPTTILETGDLSDRNNVIGQLPDTTTFFGRQPEIEQLRLETISNRVVCLYGAVGGGKSALAAFFVKMQSSSKQPDFTYFIWKSVHYAPSLGSLLSDLLKVLVPESELPETIKDKMALVVEALQANRCLIVLDAAEAWLRQDRSSSFNPYEEQYTEYGVFFRRIAEERHNSCILLTSREPFRDLMKLGKSGRPARSFQLEGLDNQAVKEIFRAKGLTDEARWDELLEPYLGNPEAIRLVASRVETFCGGSVANFLKFKTALISEVYRDTLAVQCRPGKLTHLEKQILLKLVEKIIDAPIDTTVKTAFSQLVNELQVKGKNISLASIMEAVESLKHRSLIFVSREEKTKEFLIQLPALVEEYVSKEKRSAARAEERVKLLGISQQLFRTPEASENFAV